MRHMHLHEKSQLKGARAKRKHATCRASANKHTRASDTCHTAQQPEFVHASCGGSVQKWGLSMNLAYHVHIYTQRTLL
jgi:hypothetical protein